MFLQQKSGDVEKQLHISYLDLSVLNHLKIQAANMHNVFDAKLKYVDG